MVWLKSANTAPALKICSLRRSVLLNSVAGQNINDMMTWSQGIIFFVFTEHLTGEEGSSELWGIWQLPAVSSHFQPGSYLTGWAGAVSHPFSWVSSNIHTVCQCCSFLQSPMLNCLCQFSLNNTETLYSYSVLLSASMPVILFLVNMS